MTHDSRDFTPAASNWLVRAYYTPVSDALRGQLSARLDVRREIAAAGLPAPLAGLIYTVVRRTRLWRNEKLDVAHELIAHFADGLSADRSAEELAKDFGSPQQAARLIRKAKRRNRPLWWQCYRIGSWLLLGVLVGYAALAARFYLGQPQIAHNYWREINAARQVPEAQRAWPLYREAAIKLGKTSIETEWFDDGATGKNWDRAFATLEQHRETIELCRQAAKKPRLGFYWGDPGDRQAAKAAQADWFMNYKSASVADDNESLIAATLDGVQSLRSLARLLLADARRAAITGDGAMVVADLAVTISMSEQIYQPKSCLVEQLVSFALFNYTLETAGRILADTPAVLTDEQLRALAHRIAAYHGSAVQVDFSVEQMIFDDVLQRVYTEDGHGGGRITPEGLAKFKAYSNEGSHFMTALDPRSPDDLSTKISVRLIGPGVALLIGTREENQELYHSLMDEMIVAHQGPPWQWNRQVIDANQDRFKNAMAGIRNQGRYLFVGLLFPALSAMFDAGERTIQQREAAEAVIALELWRRRHGAWPASLDELVPEYLPALPADRVDGQPLRYVVREGQPVLYSIGQNRRDDGGQPSSNADDAQTRQFGPPAPGWDASREPTGDWILWPPIKKEEEKEEASD